MLVNKDTYMQVEKENTEEAEDMEIFISHNEAGQNIIGVIKEEKKYYFNSRYKDDDIVEAWCNQHDVSHYRTLCVVFGLANGAYVRELRNRNKEMIICVYEPSREIFEKQYNTQSIDDLIDDIKTLIVVGENMFLYSIFANLLEYEIIKYTKLFVTPNYDFIFKKELKKFYDTYMESLNRLMGNRNTAMLFKKSIIKNSVNNLLDCVRQYSIYNLTKEFEKLDKSKIPAIIVAAGPSLDKNINDLKKAKGKAFIIAVDTALKPLANADIIPDISVTVDPKKPISLFEDIRVKNIPLIYELSSNEKIKNVHTGMRIYHNTECTFAGRYMSMFNKKNFYLETGGSVANDAFALARILDFKTVIFVGQDCAYPNDKGHAAAAFGDGEENDIKNQHKTLFEVEDIYGGKVKTEFNMNMYRVWFERAVQTYPDIKFIDATEGGAKKRGMEIMTLKDAIERECIIEEYIDFNSIISQTQHTFSCDEQKIIIKDISEFQENMKPIRERLQEGKRAYEKLDVLNRKLKYTGKEFKNLIQKITDINNWVTEDMDIQYLNLYTTESDFNVRDVIYEQKDNMYDDMKLIIDNGIKMMEALIDATVEVEEDFRDVIEEAKKEAAL